MLGLARDKSSVELVPMYMHQNSLRLKFCVLQVIPNF